MQILRIFHNHGIYTKTEKSFEDRREHNRQNTFRFNPLQVLFTKFKVL